MSDHEFTMSLGIRHPDIDPAKITQALGRQPGHVWRSGEQRQDQAGDAIGGEHRESYWICELCPVQPLQGGRAVLQRELTSVLDTLRRSTLFMQELHHGGGTAELFIRIFPRGDFRLELLAEEAALLGRLGVSLTIEVRPNPATHARPAGS